MSEKIIAQKAEVVAEIKEKLQKAKTVVIVDYRGLTVAEVTQLRNEFRAAGVDYKVYKNTYVARAAEELNIEGMEAHLSGPSAFAFGMEDHVSPAKIIAGFIDKNKKTQIKGGVMDGALIDTAKVNALAKLPSREVLLSRMLGSLTGSLSSLAVALNAVKEKKEA